MSKNTLKDQLDVCRNYFEDEYLQKYSERVAEVLEITYPKFLIKFGLKRGNNYMGIIYRVSIEGEKNGVLVKISTVLKVPPQDEKNRLLNRVRYLFPREAIFYSEIVPLFNELLRTRNKILENIPKCYFSNSDDCKEKTPLKILINHKALIEEDPRYTERYTDFAKDFLDHIRQFSSGILAEPYAVLTHGDLWTNNLLFKYDKDSIEPQDIYFLDFQISRYASPATDISYILYTSCSQELREKHFDELIKIYHKSLSNYLRELGSDSEKLFPYDALLDQLKNFSTFAAVKVTLILSGLTCQDDDVPCDPVKLHDISLLEERIHRDDFWRNTLRDSIKDLIDRNYI